MWDAGIQDCRDAGKEGYRKGGMQERRNARKEVCRTGRMQDWRDAIKLGCRKGGIQEVTYQERRDSRGEGSRKKGFKR